MIGARADGNQYRNGVASSAPRLSSASSATDDRTSINQKVTTMPDRDDIQRRAYELYELRGRSDGHDWDDWLQAESESRGAEAASPQITGQGSVSRRRRNERSGMSATA
jgi:hypothetical protein